jgi:hypothetical protein
MRHTASVTQSYNQQQHLCDQNQLRLAQLKLIFHEDTVEKLQDIKDIETPQTSMAEEYV